jgi:two-component system chemotaxis sensor kinase CheA
MIPDEELRALFRAESEEHLQLLDQGLLRLEKEPDHKGTLEEVFREAHSLKGAARMLGLSNIEMVAHRLEDVLRAASRGDLPLVPEHVDRLCVGVDAARKLVTEALTGEPAGVDIPAVMASLAGRDPARERRLGPEEGEVSPPAAPAEAVKAPAEPPAPPPPEAPETAGAPRQEAAPPHPPEAGEPEIPAPVPETPPPGAGPGAPAAPPGEYRIETVRVTTRNLDALMTQTGELSVTKTRVVHRLADVDDLLSWWEEWSREAATGRAGPGARAAGGALHGRLEDLGRRLQRLRNACYEDNARLDAVADKIDRGVRAMRMLPLSTVLGLFPRMVRDISREEGKEVGLELEGGEIEADKHVLERLKDPLMHMVRNAIDHGIEPPEERERAGKPRTGTVRIRCSRGPGSVTVEVRDDGRGLNLDAIREAALRRKMYDPVELAAMTPKQVRDLIFVSGFSTHTFVTDISGRGIGLDVVRTNVEELKGSVDIDSAPGGGTVFRMNLPITLATTQVLLAAARKRPYGLPVDFVETSLQVARPEIFTIEGQRTIALGGESLSVADLADLLELRAPAQAPDEEARPLVCVVIRAGEDRLGLLVDDVVGEQDVVVKAPGALLRHMRNVSGAAILGSGEVCMILSPQDLIRSVRKQRAGPVAKAAPPTAQRRRVILLVEDSITTRTQEKRVLEGAGYEVVAAVDGIEAWEKLGTRVFDAVVSDIEMPRMDGFTLAGKIRQDRRYADLPIVLVTSLSSAEDKHRGLEVGANAYITKSAFDQTVLLGTLKRLI